ncbi:class I SAM-dependent methyltransferase [Streptomyces shenzhenensis]|uniref:class I SAM-dependent methyltransferase n=1 Tax=Streptomyces shenzhenensis TaxID=943815 RepID=UPI0036C08A55
MTENDPRFSAAFWDRRYGTQQVWSGQPNPALVEEISPLSPGTALDVGCGEGADAIWLANKGWQVTGIDFSGHALATAAAHTPADLAGRITWDRADVRDWQPNEGALYDVVAAAFLQFPTPVRRSVFAALAARVAPGGHLVIVGHHPGDLHTAMPRPNEPELYYTAADLAADLPGVAWRILTRTARPRYDGTHNHSHAHGGGVLVHDTVLTAQRTEGM